MLRQFHAALSSKCNLDGVFQHQLRGLPAFIRFCSNESKYTDYGRMLGGYENRDDDIQPFRSKWRTPLIDRVGYWKSKFLVFGSKRFSGGLLRYNPENYKYMSFRQWWAHHNKSKLIFHQQIIDKRLHVLGCDLAAAHFVVYRGGAVKFLNRSNWIRDNKKNREYDDELPNIYTPEYYLEAIDFSGTHILYEGLRNIENLKCLKWLSFSRCRYFDDWCLDRITGEHNENLEYLDISHTRVTVHGLNALFQLKQLKMLVVDGLSEHPGFLEMCLELMKYYPGLTVEGLEFQSLPGDSEKKMMLSQSST